MFFAILLIATGIYIENRYAPRIKNRNSTLFLRYVPERGMPKKEKKLFSY